MPIQTAAESISTSAGSPYGFNNRIINGAMVIDQRNAGASSSTTNIYTLDRWVAYTSQSSKFTWGQNLNSVTPPEGFTNYLGVQSSSSYSVSSSDYFVFDQCIEGYNVADLGWGQSTAKSVTLSFWVRSSLTGTFGGSVQNSASNRAYGFSYTINQANTWEKETITIPGDTTGTWLTNNGVGIRLRFGLGVGSSLGNSLGWQAALGNAPTGSVSVVGTNGATWYITGVQIEKGSQATAFDYRDYGRELQLCQRYTWKYGGTVSDHYGAGVGLYADGNQIIFGDILHPQLMRSTPSMTVFGTPQVKINGTAYTGFTPAISGVNTQSTFINMQKTSHGLTASVVTNLNFGSTSDYVIFSAEL